mmetsp:Transcript_16794/g.27038  ORF Transcript_16794/g.27038 Transcript_16794/m.27038 type:complete len:105 (-) Transcript_16794:204-518(-)
MGLPFISRQFVQCFVYVCVQMLVCFVHLRSITRLQLHRVRVSHSQYFPQVESSAFVFLPGLVWLALKLNEYLPFMNSLQSLPVPGKQETLSRSYPTSPSAGFYE